MLKVKVAKRRDGFALDAQFEAPTPGVVALFGRSGCGKTTTINIIAGLLAADEARVELDGHVLADTATGISVPPEERRIGYVFQDDRLFPHMSVLRNLRYGLKRTRAPQQTIGFDQIVQLLGLELLLQRQPYQLSGGERQRVSLGRALLSQPGMLLLDEPLAALDAARREEVLPYLERLRDNLSIPMVYVSHQFDEVLQLATHVVLVDAGRVVAQGSLSEVSLLPQLRAIVGPDSVGAVVDGVVTTVDQSCGMAELRVGSGSLNVSVSRVSVGDHVRVQLLARDIILGTEEPRGLSVRNQLRGVVASVVDDEDDARLVTVDVGGINVLSRVTRGAVEALGLKSGMSVWVLVKAVSTRGHAFRMAPK
ncbi:MAG: molybdate transport system ATP-binding protein [Gammaproteobacteria bacterium]|jgi:molybdate transport system ATP-binding protein|nr:molybdate transport system ATP-binding protein [Gammaproteobacteria bacterium]